MSEGERFTRHESLRSVASSLAHASGYLAEQSSQIETSASRDSMITPFLRKVNRQPDLSHSPGGLRLVTVVLQKSLSVRFAKKRDRFVETFADDLGYDPRSTFKFNCGGIVAVSCVE